MNTDDGSSGTAVLYLRVSSVGQLSRAHDPEGYSLPGQRAACQRHADGLGARVVGEFVEHGQTGTTTNRSALREMLAQLPVLRPTFVIVYDLSRLARDDFDALYLLAQIEKAGSKLESTLERVDNTPAGRLLYTVMAGVNAFRSRGDAEKVRMGQLQKHAAGGTNGPAPLGYLNVRQLVEGREVRTVALDEDRYRLVQLAFDAFATGEHSITSLRDLLEEVGLRTRPTPKRPAKPLSRNGIYHILRDDYYVGIVTLNGVKRPGPHTPLIDRETFDKVQRTLDAHRLSGDRTQKHDHYLKGSIFCGRCGRRLVYGRYRGNGGVYEYFGCLSRQPRRPRCGAQHIPVDATETAIENHYRSVELSREQCAAIRAHIREQVQARLLVARRQSEHHARRLRVLQTSSKSSFISTTAGPSLRSLLVRTAASRLSAPKPAGSSKPPPSKPKTSSPPSTRRSQSSSKPTRPISPPTAGPAA